MEQDELIVSTVPYSVRRLISCPGSGKLRNAEYGQSATGKASGIFDTERSWLYPLPFDRREVINCTAVEIIAQLRSGLMMGD